MLATALCRHANEADALQRAFGRSLRWWLLALPAGVGLSTAKAILRLWLGYPAQRAGVNSAGNGAAMRSAVIGAALADQPVQRRTMAKAAYIVTHDSPLAIESALLVSEAAAMAATRMDTELVLNTLRVRCQSSEMLSRFAKLVDGLRANQTVADYAVAIGCGKGVSGFAPNTVAVALYAWLRHRGEFAQGIQSVIDCGGDTDSVAAITGGIMGAEVGSQGIPETWLEGIAEWPRSIPYMKQVAKALASTLEGSPMQPPTLFWPGVVARNTLFLIVVLAHGFRRLAPPY